jgi:hypothetical protein
VTLGDRAGSRSYGLSKSFRPLGRLDKGAEKGVKILLIEGIGASEDKSRLNEG